MGLFGHSRRIVIWDMQTTTNNRQVQRTKEEYILFLEEKRKFGRVVLNKNSLVNSKSLGWLLIG